MLALGLAAHPFVRIAGTALLLALSAGAAGAQDSNAADPTDAARLSADAGQWPMPARDYAATRFSPLEQINTANAKDLQLAWSFSNGINRGQESAPIVVGGTMYIVSPYPNTLYALDATTGTLKWSFAAPPNPAAKGVACCDLVNRGPVYDDGKVFFNTLDDFTVAVDAETGKEVWHVKLGDIGRGETMTMAPLVVHGKVLVGNSGGEMGVRGWLSALDEDSGKLVWRAWSTGPDADVLIGPDFAPHYDWMKGKDLGVSTWPGDRWKLGGGASWGWISYDPELDLIYYGTGNPGPWNANQRPGDNLWTTTIFARDPDTGMARWAYQTSPHDLWDHDGVNELVLMDLEIDGKARHVLVRPGRNGYMYVIDRETGEVISADAYDTVTAYKGVDLQTGRIIPNEAKTPHEGRTVDDVCPAPPGAKDWQPSAYSPQTGLIYVPHQHLCMSFAASQVGYIAGTPYVGATVDMYAAPGNGYRGEYMAWDPVARKKVWAIHEKFPVWSGTLVTAGNVAVYGTMDRWLKAVDATSGELLWKMQTPSGIVGQPTTYLGSDGRQYIAILSGVGGWPGVVANAEIDPRVRNGALGFTGAVQDLPAYTTGGSTLLVFALPGDSTRVAAKPPAPEPDTPITPAADEAPPPPPEAAPEPPAVQLHGEDTEPGPGEEPPIAGGADGAR